VHRTQTDGELVAAVLAGDRRAFGALVDRHVGRATALARRLLGSRAETEDVVQEATLQAYLGLRELREPERFGAWFSAIAANLARMRLRETRGRLVPLDGIDGTFASDDPLETRERLRAIHEALAKLSSPEREAVLLHYVGGLTTPEIAFRADEQVGTVRVRLHRARRRLQLHLAALAPTTREERSMIEVEVRDVVVRSLMARLLEAMGGHVKRVVVSSLRDTTFYAAVHVADGTTQELDARPSDGINLAVRVGAPIFVDEEVLESAGFGATDEAALDRELNERCAKHGEEPPAGEWRSLTPDLMTSWHPPLGR
jgi:RNA polymerase sigma-70 factor, ECF subfamily